MIRKRECFVSSDCPRYLIGFKNFQPGEILGKAILADCVLIDKEIAALIKEQRPDEYAFGDFTPGRYAWVMENPVAFDKPIPARGKQGLWNWEGDVQDER